MSTDDDRPEDTPTPDETGDGGTTEWAALRAAVLAEVERLGERGGPSLRPAAVHAAQPLTGIGVPANDAGGPNSADAGGLGRYGPGADVGGFRIAGAVPGSGGTAGIVNAASGAAAGRRWQSARDWVGPLSGSAERRLLLVACEVVTGIANGPGWASFDGPRPDLAAELDAIDEHAHHLAELRAETGGEHEAVPQAWRALVDRVTALTQYAQRLAAATQRPGSTNPDQYVERSAADAAHDELAADHLRLLAGDLPTPPSELP